MPVQVGGEGLAKGGSCVAVQIGSAARSTALIENVCAFDITLDLTCVWHHLATVVERARQLLLSAAAEALLLADVVAGLLCVPRR